MYQIWKNLGFSNHYMFRLVMEKEELCRQLLERVLDIKITKLKYLAAEKSIEAKLQAKGIRLDVYIEDDQGTAYDLEMQMYSQDKVSLGKRTRYYQALMDAEALGKSKAYKELRKSYVIFICTFDPFDRNLGRYTFKNTCQEDFTLGLNDDNEKIFINTRGNKKGLSKELGKLMDYINSGIPEDAFTSCLDNEVQLQRQDKKKEEIYMMGFMTLERDMAERIYEAEERGEKRGEERGVNKNTTHTIMKMVQRGYSNEDILEIFPDWTVEKIETLRKNLEK